MVAAQAANVASPVHWPMPARKKKRTPAAPRITLRAARCQPPITEFLQREDISVHHASGDSDLLTRRLRRIRVVGAEPLELL